MALKYSTTLRTNQVGQIETTVGTSPKLQLFTGAPPANCAAADSGTKIAEGDLPSDWLAAAASGAVAKTGTWTVTGLPAAGAGTDAGHFRIKDSSGSTCHIQGTVDDTGSPDMTLDNANIANGQVVTVNTFQITAGNA